jgi:serine O-acetyltransferase
MNLINIILSDLKARIENGGQSAPKSRLKLFTIFLKYMIIRNGIRSIVLYRICRYFYVKNIKSLYYVAQFFNLVFSRIEISVTADIGQGLVIPHPQCIVIGGEKLGSNVKVFQGVTIGLKKDLNEYPTLGNNVFLSAGSMVLGNVTVGDNVRVGAKSVVLSDIPSDSVAVGIPAKIK